MDFINWLFGKHYIVAAVLFPQTAFFYGLYMRWTLYTAVMAVLATGNISLKFIAALIKK